MTSTHDELQTLAKAELDVVAGGIKGAIEGTCDLPRLPPDPVLSYPITYGLGAAGALLSWLMF
jgi:hypothetical protein